MMRFQSYSFEEALDSKKVNRHDLEISEGEMGLGLEEGL
jgi:hypothetical protein